VFALPVSFRRATDSWYELARSPDRAAHDAPEDSLLGAVEAAELAGLGWVCGRRVKRGDARGVRTVDHEDPCSEGSDAPREKLTP
jgi:hypothetical protein